MSGWPAPDPDHGVYGITTAAELVGMGPQNLRLYEARGLLEPDRTEGGTRRYSADDLDRLRRIGDLLDSGLNLAGISMVLSLERENAQLRAKWDERERQPSAQPLHERAAPSRDGSADSAGTARRSGHRR